MKGMDWESVEEFVGEDKGRFGEVCEVYMLTGLRNLQEGEVLPLGTKRMSSHHVIGSREYLLVLRNPISISSSEASSQSNCF